MCMMMHISLFSVVSDIYSGSYNTPCIFSKIVTIIFVACKIFKLPPISPAFMFFLVLCHFYFLFYMRVIYNQSKVCKVHFLWPLNCIRGHSHYHCGSIRNFPNNVKFCFILWRPSSERFHAYDCRHINGIYLTSFYNGSKVVFITHVHRKVISEI